MSEIDLSRQAEEFLPGKPMIIKRSQFTDDVQRNIIDQHFGITRRGGAPQPQPGVPNEGISSQDIEDLKRLRNVDKLMKDPRFAESYIKSMHPNLREQARITPQATESPALQQPQQANMPVQQPMENDRDKNEQTLSSTDWVDDFLRGSGNPGNQQSQQVQQPAPSVSNPSAPQETARTDQPIQNQAMNDNVNRNDQAEQMQRQMLQLSVEFGKTPEELTDILNKIDVRDVLRQYINKGNQQGREVQQTAPPNLAEVPKANNVPIYQGIGNQFPRGNKFFDFTGT